MNEKRDSGLDFIKAFATILVILGHVIQFSNENFDESLLFKFIYSFHMPLFMFISGYLYFNANQATASKNKLKKRCETLLVPFFVWTVISVSTSLIYSYCSGLEVLSSAKEMIIDIILYPDSSLWFLWVLFLCIILFEIIKGKYEIYFGFAIIFLLYVVQFADGSFKLFGFGLLRWHFFFFLIGYVSHKKQIFDKEWGFCLVLFTFLVAITFISQWHRLEINSIFNLQLANGMVKELALLFIKYASAVAAILFIFMLKKYFENNNRHVRFISDNSLAFYALQFPVIMIVLKMQFFSNFFLLSNQLFIFIATSLITYSLVMLLNKNVPLSRVLFGKVVR